MAVMAETIDIIAACNIQGVTSGYEEIRTAFAHSKLKFCGTTDVGKMVWLSRPPRMDTALFYAFDLLYLDDRDLRQFPLIERKEKLRAVKRRYLNVSGWALFCRQKCATASTLSKKAQNSETLTLSGAIK